MWLAKEVINFAYARYVKQSVPACYVLAIEHAVAAVPDSLLLWNGLGVILTQNTRIHYCLPLQLNDCIIMVSDSVVLMILVLSDDGIFNLIFHENFTLFLIVEHRLYGLELLGILSQIQLQLGIVKFATPCLLSQLGFEFFLFKLSLGDDILQGALVHNFILVYYLPSLRVHYVNLHFDLRALLIASVL